MTPRWTVIALVASVGLNIFLIGVGGTAWVMRPHEHTALPERLPLTASADALKPADAAAFRAMLNDESRKMAPNWRAARAARREAAELFAKPVYDRAAVGAALDRARASEGQVRAEVEGAVLDFAQRLDQQERSVLAVNLRRGFDGRRHSLGADKAERKAERMRRRNLAAGDDGGLDDDGTPASSSASAKPGR